jgi:hypothetical protein
LIREPVRTIEVAYFLRYCLLTCTDRALLMVGRRVADLWRRAAKDANQVLIHWADLYRELLGSLGALVSDATVTDSEIRERLRSLVAAHQQRKPPTRAHLVREHFIEEIRPVRSLLSALVLLRWQATPGRSVLAALQLLNGLYEYDVEELPVSTSIEFGKVSKTLLSGQDRERACRAFEVATLLSLRRALRNGTVWIDHSLAFRSRERLFIPAAIWQRERELLLTRYTQPEPELELLLERLHLTLPAQPPPKISVAQSASATLL